MFLSSLTDGGATPALVQTLVFHQHKLRVTAENIANMHAPGYRAKHLDRAAFQQSLRKAMDRRTRRTDPFIVEGNPQAWTDRTGRLQVRAVERPPSHVLFHDGTNVSIEQEMTDLAQTGAWYELAATLLTDRFQDLRGAIRGTVS